MESEYVVEDHVSQLLLRLGSASSDPTPGALVGMSLTYTNATSGHSPYATDSPSGHH